MEGGNDQIVSRMLAELPAGTVKYGNALTALRANANGSVTGTFLSGRKYTDVHGGPHHPRPAVHDASGCRPPRGPGSAP